jgi:hypothetical protein
MSDRFLNALGQYADVSGFTMLRANLRQFWYQLPSWVRAIYWLEILGVIAVLSLLLVFHQVVQGVVVQADLRREVMTMHAEATWRCNALQGLRASQSCLLQLKTPPLAEALLANRSTPVNSLVD